MFSGTLDSWRRTARPATFVMFFTAFATVAHAQTPPYGLFQYSTLTGSGNTITASWVPVVNASGKTAYYDVTLQFDVDSSGNLTLASGFPQVVASPSLTVANFTAGKYAGPSTVYRGDFVINVSGPGVTSGGATEWSLAAPTGGDNYTYPGSGTWYVGPITSNPLSARLKKANITSTAWSYGVSSSQWGGNWGTNVLIGVSQVGNTITIVSFTNAIGDHNSPVDQITYTLTP